MRDIGKTLHALRREAGLTQKEVARQLSAVKPITHQAVSKWETGAAQPNLAQFLQLCRLYNVRDVVSAFGLQAEDNALNAEGRRRLAEYAQLLRLSGLYSAPAAPRPAPARMLPLYQLPASAGTGQPLDSDHYELVEADDAAPLGAHFGVRLAGDSMAPRFADGQVVWVQKQPALESGSIGLFLYDGDAYCKLLEAKDDHVRLLSLNPKYPPIEIARPDELRVFGRVL